MRWHYRDAALLWLLPASYLLHLAEELAFGFRTWVAQLAGLPLPLSAFLSINAVVLAALAVGIGRAVRSEASGWIAVGAATALALNGVLHLLGTLATAAYSPGLVTGIVLYIPIGSLVLLRAWHQAPRRARRRGVWAGLAVHAAVTALALFFTRR